MKKKILITWWLWYIGSHVCVDFIQAWYDVFILDNISNTSLDVHIKIEDITSQKVPLFVGDFWDKIFLDSIFSQYSFDLVVHLAGKKFVSESILSPFLYYDVNVVGTLVLLETMEKYKVSNFIFSSTAGVYDSENLTPPFQEDDTKKTIHPYASSKLIIEEILFQLALTNKMRSISLRYFNVIGAHESWKIGDNYLAQDTNVLGYIYKTALWIQKSFTIYGNDFDTFDGTAVRDYVDVNDLSNAHIKSFEYLTRESDKYFSLPINVWNWGIWMTVLQLINLCEKSFSCSISYIIQQKRIWDVGVSIASVEKAKKILWWVPSITTEKSIISWWNYLRDKASS